MRVAFFQAFSPLQPADPVTLLTLGVPGSPCVLHPGLVGSGLCCLAGGSAAPASQPTSFLLSWFAFDYNLRIALTAPHRSTSTRHTSGALHTFGFSAKGPDRKGAQPTCSHPLWPPNNLAPSKLRLTAARCIPHSKTASEVGPHRIPSRFTDKTMPNNISSSLICQDGATDALLPPLDTTALRFRATPTVHAC